MLHALFALQETELRTLKASAEDIAAKFDEAVAALTGKRLDVQLEVRADRLLSSTFVSHNRGSAKPQLE
jgi:hypothetical protein